MGHINKEWSVDSVPSRASTFSVPQQTSISENKWGSVAQNTQREKWEVGFVPEGNGKVLSARTQLSLEIRNL